MGNICTLYVLGRNYVCFGVLQVHICTHSTDMNVSVVHLQNVISSYPQMLLSYFGSFWVLPKDGRIKIEGICFLFSVLFILFFLFRMEMEALSVYESCHTSCSIDWAYVYPEMKYNVDCGMCILCVFGYAQNESERKNYCMCAARTSKIEFPSTTNSKSLPFSRSVGRSLTCLLFNSQQPHTDTIRYDVMWICFGCSRFVCSSNERSLSLLCFGSALLLLFRIVFFMRSRMFFLRFQSVLMV